MSDGQRPTGAARGGGENHPPAQTPEIMHVVRVQTKTPQAGLSGLDLDLDLDSFIKRAKRASSEWRSGRYLHLELPKPCELRGRI